MVGSDLDMEHEWTQWLSRRTETVGKSARLYYAQRTLLYGEPDVNRRFIYANDEKIAVFNDEMRPWTEEDDHRLKVCIKALNADENKSVDVSATRE
jgi:hypothetical protein